LATPLLWPLVTSSTQRNTTMPASRRNRNAPGQRELHPGRTGESIPEAAGCTPVAFLMVGLPGAGKTVRAKELAAERRALLLNPDAWMIPLFGLYFES
jgi:hypothetical protein